MKSPLQAGARGPASPPRRRHCFSPAVAAALLCAAAPAAASDPLPPPRLEQIEADNGVKGLRATFLVEASAERLMEMLWDTRRFTRIFPGVKKAEIVERVNENEVIVAFVIDASIRDAAYSLRRTREPDDRRIRWMRESGDGRYIAGSWHVTPLDPTRSQVVYESFVHVGFFIPSGWVRNLAIRRANGMVERVRAALPAVQETAPPADAAPAPLPEDPPRSTPPPDPP